MHRKAMRRRKKQGILWKTEASLLEVLEGPGGYAGLTKEALLRGRKTMYPM